MAPSTRDLPPFPNPNSPLHSYVSNSLSSYTFNGGGGGGPSPTVPKTSPLQPSTNGITPSHNVIQGVPPSVYVNGPSFTHNIHNANSVKTGADHSTNESQYGITSSKAATITNSTEQVAHSNGSLLAQPDVASPRRPSLWYEEEIDENLRWSFGLTSILFTGCSRFQEIALLDTEPFGKVLTLDRKMQSAEKDEWVYHECLVHPPLLLHQWPKSVYIMGGGEGSTAREALRHRSVRKVVMCDIDEEVVKFCKSHLTCNAEAFQSNRLELVIDDAKANLESRDECFDIIIGDLADPLEWGPCYLLYTKGFYESIVKPKLNPGGILVTQAGPAGILSHKEVFTSIYNTLRQVFTYVVAYSAHVPSYADTWGWVMASDQPFTQISAIDELDCKIKQRIKGELRYLDGATLHASTILNKTVRESLAKESHVYTEESARFLYGHGRSANAH
ncbi:hypothetical protein GOP47_0028461 [Adiantum capillus-veneris]|nr:hypothetical protein GOP47_0028461 [Adiantum capillus-veneris]